MLDRSDSQQTSNCNHNYNLSPLGRIVATVVVAFVVHLWLRFVVQSGGQISIVRDMFPFKPQMDHEVDHECNHDCNHDCDRTNRGAFVVAFVVVFVVAFVVAFVVNFPL